MLIDKMKIVLKTSKPHSLAHCTSFKIQEKLVVMELGH